MIRFYYTGADKFLAPQTDPLKSLGGYISSSVVPNEELNAVFQAISLASSENKDRSTIILAVKNEESVAIRDINIYIKYNGSVISTIKMDACLPSGSMDFEKLPSIHSIPYSAELEEYTEDSKLAIADKIDPGQYIGLWIQRIVNGFSDELSPDYLYSIYPEKPSNVESIEVTIDYKKL